MNFQILGPLRVTDDAGNDLPLAGAKPAALLALLLLHPNEVVSADQLIENLWDGDAPENAAKTLQVHVSRLRRALGSAGDGSLMTRNGGYSLRVGAGELDSLRFAELVADASAALAEGAHARASARVRDALELWRGEPLSEFAYASFAQNEIVRLEEMRVTAIEVRIEAEMALGRHADLIAELQSLVARYPVRERLRAQLMLALYRSGRQADALEAYRAGRRTLVGELGIEPGAELRDLERAILAQDESLAAAPRQRRTKPPADPGPRGPFVGYDRELSTLEELLERTLAGAGGLALVVGEPGIGKSRLSDELSAVARARGADVLWGRCWEAGGAPPYWPWIQALRAHVRDSDPDDLRAQLGVDAAEIAELLPELRDLLPDLPAAGLEDSATGSRFRVFDAVAALLRRVAAEQPLVVVLDDIHAADEPSLLLLQFLAGALADAPVLIIGAYRDTEVGADHPLRPILSDLGRTGNSVRVSLGGLTEDDTAHFVELSASVAPMPRLAAALHEASGGNPLFVTELARLLAAEDRLQELDEDSPLLLPGGLGEVIARRVHHLSDRCRRTLAVAAVVGREFETVLVEAVGDSQGEALVEDCAEAANARVIDGLPGTRGTMRFSHVLVGKTLYDELGASQRRRLHAAVGEAIERLYAPRLEPELARLAHHFTEALPAADPVKAIDYLGRAADAAAALLAYEEAIRLYGLAAEIARTSAADPSVRADALVRLGEQLVHAGRAAEAEEALTEAEAAAGDGADEALLGRIAIARANLDLLDACDTGEERLLEVLALFQRLGDPADEARAWWALRAWHCGIGQMETAGEMAERMLECARAAGNSGLVCQAIVGIASSCANGPMPVSVAIPRVRALLREATNARAESLILMSLAELEVARGRFDDARALVAKAHARVQDLERANDVALAFACRRATIELLAGDAQKAEEIMRVSCEQLERLGFIAYLRSDVSYLADTLLKQGRLEEAEAELARADAMYQADDVDAIQRAARARARLQLARGDVEGAERSMKTSLEYVYKMEMPTEHAEGWLTMADVLAAAGRDADARDAALEALACAKAKEHTLYADRAREMLASLEPALAAD